MKSARRQAAVGQQHPLEEDAAEWRGGKLGGSRIVAHDPANIAAWVFGATRRMKLYEGRRISTLRPHAPVFQTRSRRVLPQAIGQPADPADRTRIHQPV